MQASERVVFGRTFTVTPRWLWILQRLSALALGPLVALHVASPTLSANRIVMSLLLISIGAHGFSGLRRLASPKRRGAFRLVAIAWCAIVLVLGGWIVISA